MPKKGKKKTKKKTPEQIQKELEEQRRKQLMLVSQKLENDINIEDKDFNEFQQEREKLNYFWIVSKKELEDNQTLKRNKERELQDLKEKCEVEIKSYKQRVKHLLYEQQSTITEEYINSELTVKQLEDKYREEEEYLKKDCHDLEIELKEMELRHENYLKTLKQEHDKQITTAREEVERESKEYNQKYEKMSKDLRDQLEAKRKDDINRIELRKNNHIAELMKSHEKAFAEIKNYYNDITHNNLDLIKSLKEEVAALKKKEAQDEKMMYEVAQENKNMAEPLSKALEDVKILRAKLEQYNKDKIRLKENQAILAKKEEILAKNEWEHEVLLQRFDHLKKDRDRLFDSFQDAIYDVHQKSGLKNLLLEKKLNGLKDELIKKEAQLNEALVQASLETSVFGTITRKLDDVIEVKNQMIRDLRAELERVIRAHNHAIECYEGRMLDYAIPVEELGFRPRLANLPEIQLIPTSMSNRVQNN